MKRLWEFSKPYVLHVITAAICSVISASAGVWVIDILKNLINQSLTGKMDGMAAQIGKGAVVIVLGMAASYLVIQMTGYFSAGVLRDIRKATMEHVVKLSPDFMEKNNYGDMIARMSSDVEGIAAYLSTYFKDCLYMPIMVIIYCVYLFSVNVTLALVCLVPLCILVPLSIKLLEPIKRSQMEYVQKLGETNNNIQEVCDGIAVVKSYGLQKVLSKKYFEDLHKTLVISKVNDLRQYNAAPVSILIAELPVAAALCVGGTFVFQGKITLGVLVAFISVMKNLIDPMTSAYQLVVRSKLAFVSVKRVFYILDTKPEWNEKEEEKSAPQAEVALTNEKTASKAEIEMSKAGEEEQEIFKLSHVSFAYHGMLEKKNALEDISAVIRKGEKTAFVGRSGGGKSTLLKLLYKHYEISEGDIFFKGINYKKMNPNALRHQIALISQDVYLFPISIADNIRIGKPDATEEEVVEAAKLANCDEFIRKLSDGYQTLAGEKGSTLSGGQRQRISIARAILKNSDVILLDEPTSALDPESEHLVNEAIDRITKGKTVVVVAHRMSTIVNSDQILVVDAGRIAEQGRHNELMEQNGIYAQLYREYTKEGVA